MAVQDWDGVFNFMVKDHQMRRLSAEWQIKMAMVLVFMDKYDGAIKLIDDLYTCNKHVTDGFAWVGWAHFLSSRNEQSLQMIVDKDVGLKRPSIF